MTMSEPYAARPFISSSIGKLIRAGDILPLMGPEYRLRSVNPRSATYVHSRCGSLSRLSSVTHASAQPRLPHHARTAVVLPNPGGAATSVSGTPAPVSSARMIRGR